MIHAREDYNRIQDPAVNDPSLIERGATPIAEDEPVFLMRAKDENFIEMLCIYARIMESEGTDMGSKMAAMIDGHIKLAQEWQATHGCKTPDV